MEKKVEKNGSQVVISFVANGDEWKKAQDKEFNKLSAKLKVDGFRQGHVPASIAKARINPVEVLQDAMFTLVNKEYANVLNEEKLNVIAEPKLNVTKLSETELECTVTVALPPVVTLGDYKGIKVEKVIKEVTEEDVNDALNKELNNHATLNLKDGAAENGDTVTIDFKGYIDDIPFDGGEARGYDLKLGSNSFVPGFEDQLVGIKSEEERTIDIKFPENYVENLAGKDAKFVVKCHEVKQTVLPELNDEFINELDLEGIKTVEEYKEKIKNDLTEKANREADNARLNAIVDTIVDNATVDIADTLLADEANAMIDNIKKQVESNGLKFEDYLNINNINKDQLFADKKKEAEHNIKGMLVIDEICRKENIIVDSKALNDKYAELAKLYNMKVEDIKKALEPNKNEVLRNLRNELFTKFILENNKD